MNNNDLLEERENPFGLSIGDLMAAILFIFVLLLMSALLNIHREREDVIEVAKGFLENKAELYENLSLEFSSYVDEGIISIDSTDNNIRFESPHVKFKSGSKKLRPQFKILLDDFFPRYINILEQYKNVLTEIRIEGHTSETHNKQSEFEGYFYNMDLSQARTRSTLKYCLQLIKNDSIKYEWVKPLITANGLSSSKLILNRDGSLDRESSRRVEFKVRTNAEKKLDEIYKRYLNDD